MFEKVNKLRRQWSTYRGLFLTIGAAFAFPAVQAAELIDIVFTAGSAAIGLYDTVRDSDSE